MLLDWFTISCCAWRKNFSLLFDHKFRFHCNRKLSLSSNQKCLAIHRMRMIWDVCDGKLESDSTENRVKSSQKLTSSETLVNLNSFLLRVLWVQGNFQISCGYDNLKCVMTFNVRVFLNESWLYRFYSTPYFNELKEFSSRIEIW